MSTLCQDRPGHKKKKSKQINQLATLRRNGLHIRETKKVFPYTLDYIFETRHFKIHKINSSD